MRVIFDKVEDEVFIEIILREEEIEKLHRRGVSKDFEWKFFDMEQMNIFIHKEDEDATS